MTALTPIAKTCDTILMVLGDNEQFLPKPFLPDELFQRVNAFMSEPVRGLAP